MDLFFVYQSGIPHSVLAFHGWPVDEVKFMLKNNISSNYNQLITGTALEEYQYTVCYANAHKPASRTWRAQAREVKLVMVSEFHILRFLLCNLHPESTCLTVSNPYYSYYMLECIHSKIRLKLCLKRDINCGQFVVNFHSVSP